MNQLALDNSSPFRAWLVCLSSALFFFYVFVQMNLLTSIEPSLFSRFHVSSSGMAKLSEMYFYGNVLFLFPAGLLLDRFSTRKILLMVVTISIIATIYFAGAQFFWKLEAARFIIGVAGSFCLLAPVRLASRWFKPEKMALVIGVIVTMAMLGGMVSQAPFSMLVAKSGAVGALQADVFLGAIILLLVFMFVKDAPNTKAAASSVGQKPKSSCVARLRPLWILGLIVSILMALATIFIQPLLYLDAGGYDPVHHKFLVELALASMILFGVLVFVKGDNQGGGCHEQSAGLWQSIREVLSRKQNWFAGLYASLINLPVFYLGGFWGVNYLMQMHHLPRTQASLVNSMLFLGMIIGAPAFGWLSDKIKQRKLPMIIGAIVSLIIGVVMLYAGQLAFASLIALFFLLGFFIGSQVMAYPMVVESNPLHLTGSAEGVASVLIMSGGFTVGLFTQMLNWHWSHTVINNVPLYSPADYFNGMALIVGAFVVALILSFVVRETGCKHYAGK